MTHGFRVGRLRAEASLLDAVVILGWALFAAAIGVGLRSFDVALTSAGSRDSLAFLTLVLPVVVTFALQEASPARATFGKARRGLTVTSLDGERIDLSRSAIRSAVKFLPWQLAHSAVFRLIDDPSATVWAVAAVAAQVLVVASVVTAARTGRALHDFVAGTRVWVPAPPGGTTEAA